MGDSCLNWRSRDDVEVSDRPVHAETELKRLCTVATVARRWINEWDGEPRSGERSTDCDTNNSLVGHPEAIVTLLDMIRTSLVILMVALTLPRAVVAKERLTFERDIRPIFRAHCYDCHGAAKEMKGELDLRQVRRMIKGGESGPAIIVGMSQKSHLVERLLRGEMPPGDSKLTKKEIAVITQWIDAGARTARPESKSIGLGLGITPEERSFWAFQPVRRPSVPATPANSRVRTAVDALVFAQSENRASFAADATRLTLIKRAYFALTGLPPSPEEVNRLRDTASSNWFEQLVDELLASPRYGEYWARHWLDVAGYADSEGYNDADAKRSWAWKYRDWVIRSFNSDKPFNTFVIEQLAGDELAGPRGKELTPRQIELLTATGFLRMAADGTFPRNRPQDRNQVVADTLRIVSTSLLGLSVHCSQCHDHRYDPIPQTDYYAMRAVFEPALNYRKWRTPPYRLVTLYTDRDRERAAKFEKEARDLMAQMKAQESKYMAEALKAELVKYEDPLRSQLRKAFHTPKDKRTQQQKDLLFRHPKLDNLNTGELYLYIKPWRAEKAEWYKKMAAARAKKPKEEFLRALIELPGPPPETRLFHRGDYKQPKQQIAPAALTVTSAAGKRRQFALDDEKLKTTGRRLAFAQWLTDKDHPLVARVIVNRVWMHHFGQGIVHTPSDFGKFGARPTHPQLLDWLADEFVRSRWSIKALHRLIMRSTVWRQKSNPQTSTVPSTAVQRRMPPTALRPIRRLEAEAIRDRMLMVAGFLTPRMYGAPDEVQEDIGGRVVVNGQATRRSIYVEVRRSQPLDMLRAFDAPVMETNCERRSVSTVATQSLMLLNGDFILQQAGRLAARATREASNNTLADQMERAWQLALCRRPTDDELRLVQSFAAKQLAYLKENRKDAKALNLQVLTNVCQVLLSSNEFLYLE